jgi:dTDP-4-dehydrorhamnose reductase
MTRILIFGATGMLGHVLRETCEGLMETHATVRAEGADTRIPPGARERLLTGVRVEEPATVEWALDHVAPDVAVNCIGIVKQSDAARDAARMDRVNARFPHELAAACAARGVRLVHVSTDCVFSGRRGRYTEDDVPDPVDEYGRSKLAGEVEGPGVLTVRTSMIGRELGTRNGLLEWFLAQAGGSVAGFARAVFTGPTVPELSRVIARVATDHPTLEGTFHVGAEPISKLDLLMKARAAFDLDVEIDPVDEPVVDRSLDSTRMRTSTGWNPPGWDRMLEELAATAGSADRPRMGDAARR